MSKKYFWGGFTKVLATFTLVSAMTLASANPIDKGDIRFQPGANFGEVSGAVIRGERDQYSLVAAAGQFMKVEIRSEEDNAVFQLSIYSYGTGAEVPLEGAAEGEDAKHWVGQLPKPGYSKDGKQNVVTLVVGGTRGNASYTLKVTIQDQAFAAGGDANSANGKYRGLIQTLNCPQDKKQYGEFYDYHYWEGGAWCGQTGKAGYWVWQNPNWYVWAEQASGPDQPASGLIKSLDAGDTGCYVTFTGNDGKEHNALAAFEVCDQQGFLHRKASFSYVQENVMSPECGGDPECTKSEKVWIITKLK